MPDRSPAAARGQQGSPVLFLVIDGIPHDLAQEVFAAGQLGALGPPLPVVSTFPSLTHVAVPALLGPLQETRPPGYEARWLDPGSGQVHGGLRHDVDAPGLERFDERPTTLAGHLAVYVVPRALGRGMVRWVTRRFLAEGGAWLGYLAATDGLAHFAGRDALRDALVDIADTLTTLRRDFAREHGVQPGVVICSDHGFEFGRFQHVGVDALTRVLALEGLQVGVPGEGDVTLAPYGDVGAGAAWTRPAQAGLVAELIAQVPGVDVVCARTPDGCEVVGVGPGGLERAALQWDTERVTWLPGVGDPLGLAPIAAATGTTTWTPDLLLRVSWDHPYPCAPWRIRGAFEDLVDHPAQVVWSMDADATYGPELTHRAARLRGGQVGTHGALRRAQTLGFVASTEDMGPPGPRWQRDVFRPWWPLLALSRSGP